MRKHLFFKYIIAILLIISPGSSSGLIFRHYTINEGLANNAIFAILQDSKGLMWFGSICGLHHFDGKQIKQVKISAGETRIGQIIYAITEDQEKCLWIATDDGVGIYDLKQDRFYRFEETTADGVSIHSQVRDVTTDSKGNIWIATMEQGLFYYDYFLQRLTQFRSPFLPSDHIKHIQEDRSGFIWITTIDKGVCLLDPNSNLLYTYANEEPLKGWCTFEDSNAGIWFGTDKGLYQLDKKTNRFICRLSPFLENGVLEIKEILENENKELLLATDEGLVYYNIDTREIRVEKADPGDRQSLNDNYLHALYKDREQGLWIGSYFGGVNYLSPLNNNFVNYKKTDIPFPARVISVFEKEDDDNIWVGSDDAGIFHWSLKDGKVTPFYPNDRNKQNHKGLTYPNVHALLFDAPYLYVGMYMGGMDIYNTVTGKWRNFSPGPDSCSLADPSVYAIYKDVYDKLWIGTTSGLQIYNPEKQTFQKIKEVGNADVRIITEDQKGYLWIGTCRNGIFRLNRKNNKWEQFRYDKNVPGTIPSDKITAFSTDEKQNLWIGTEETGLVRYNYDTGEFISHPLTEATSQAVYAIVPDRHILWLTTSNGLLMFNPENGIEKIYTAYDGLRSNQFLPRAAVKLSNGEILLGSINGINAFKANELQKNHRVPEIIFSDFRLYNHSITPHTPDSPLESAISYTNQITLDYQSSVFTIGFAALSYTAPDKNRYAYKLDGFDNEWRETNESSVSYNNLPAGSYTLHVKAANPDGVWNREGITMHIKILPPWWLSWPLLLVYALFISCIIICLFYKQEKRNKEELRLVKTEKDAELYNLKIEFFTNIIHEIRTPLTLILAPLERIRNHPGEVSDVKAELQLIERNGKRLLSLVNQLMDFRKVEVGRMEIHTVPTDVVPLLKNIYGVFESSATLKNIEMGLDIPSEACYALIDKEAFTKVISNLLSNALKYTASRITLKLTQDLENKVVEIAVTDNGKGIRQNEQKKIFEPFYQIKDQNQTDNIGTGVGLLLVKKLMQLMKSELRLESEIGKGSTFYLRFPHQPVQPDTLIETASFETPLIITPQKEHQKCLIVEDNLDLLDFLCDLFADNFAVFKATNGKEALTILNGNPPDIVISDLMMPEMDGYQLCSEIKNNIATSHIPVLLLTAKVDNEDKIEGFECGADTYMEKPFVANVLVAQVCSILQNRERMQKNYLRQPGHSITTIACNKTDEEFLIRLSSFIEENLLNPDFSMDELAGKLMLGRSNFYSKVKKLTGMTPNDFVRVLRLKRAVAYFDEGEFNIKQVCFKVGFGSPSYFTKCFQQQFGVSPSDYIRQKQEICI